VTTTKEIARETITEGMTIDEMIMITIKGITTMMVMEGVEMNEDRNVGTAVHQVAAPSEGAEVEVGLELDVDGEIERRIFNDDGSDI
jgi:hypothetical protein